jgi:hypothetical protein
LLLRILCNMFLLFLIERGREKKKNKIDDRKGIIINLNEKRKKIILNTYITKHIKKEKGLYIYFVLIIIIMQPHNIHNCLVYMYKS